MSRFIDAEQLFEQVRGMQPRNQQHYECILTFLDMIADQPQVNAIPIEVIDNLKSAIDTLPNEISVKGERTVNKSRIFRTIDEVISDYYI